MEEEKKEEKKEEEKKEAPSRSIRRRAPRGKCWCFTLNNYTPADVEYFQNLTVDTSPGRNMSVSPFRYMIAGKEVGENGTPHLQGYFELRDSRAISFVQKIADPFQRCHLELRKASSAGPAIDYCKKDGRLIVEKGAIVEHPGKRTDLHDAIEAINQGVDMVNVARQHSSAFVRNHGGLMRYSQMTRAPGTEPIEDKKVYCFWGVAGSGKTEAAYAYARKHNYRMYRAITPTGRDLQWFDGLTPDHDLVYFDDYKGELSFNCLLQLLDKWPIQLPVKGSHTVCAAKRILFSSNIHPRHWYMSSMTTSPAVEKAFIRRFTGIYHFTHRYDDAGAKTWSEVSHDYTHMDGELEGVANCRDGVRRVRDVERSEEEELDELKEEEEKKEEEEEKKYEITDLTCGEDLEDLASPLAADISSRGTSLPNSKRISFRHRTQRVFGDELEITPNQLGTLGEYGLYNP